uniref:Uncharacterized protein n=1 Tax=Anguilla anguilla TaxID=7936 RepID=A0A0E9S7N6_ANGAN
MTISLLCQRTEKMAIAERGASHSTMVVTLSTFAVSGHTHSL